MKILHVIPAIGMSYGGPSIAIQTITKSLIKIGVNIDVATTTANGRDELDVPINTRVEMDQIGYYFFERQFKEWKFSWALTKWLKTNLANYDIVHVHAVFCYPSWPVRIFAINQKIPYILRPAGILDPWCLKQNYLKKRLYYELIERKNLQLASGIHVTSNLEVESLNLLGFNCNIFNISHAVTEMGIIQRISPPKKNRMRVLFLSRLHFKKGIADLLKAIAILVNEKKSVYLTLAGDGDKDYIAGLKKEVHLLKLEQFVKFIGYVEDQKKIEIFSDHDVFVLPSYQENFAIAAAEAMSSGLPVVITDKVGLADEVKLYKAGRVVPAKNPEKLAEAIWSFWDIETWGRCHQNALRLIKSKFTLDALGLNLVQMYQKILKKDKT